MIRSRLERPWAQCLLAALAAVVPEVRAAAPDVASMPAGAGGAFAISRPGLADGRAMLYRPYFNDAYWWGDLQAYAVAADATVATSPSWSATLRLDARDPDERRILTRRDDTGTAVPFRALDDLSPTQRSALGDQDMLDYLRGVRDEEGDRYRRRATLLGDIVHATPVHVVYEPGEATRDRVFVGANDGMLHAFDASSGEEVFAYVPSHVLPRLPALARTDYVTAHRYSVDGDITVADVALAEGGTRKLLVGALGAGGQALYALDVSSPDAVDDAALAAKLLWETGDGSPGYADLGYTIGEVLIAPVRDGDGQRPAVIVGNGYASTAADAHVGGGDASLFVIDALSGELIRRIDTGSGDATSPSGLSSPSAVDLDADGVVDLVYAGDLGGRLWRFDLRASTGAAWHVAAGGDPLFRASVDGSSQAITVAPRVLRHPDGGLQVFVGTGRLLEPDDVASTGVDSVYGLHDRLDGRRLRADTLVRQTLHERLHAGGTRVRASSAHAVPSALGDGWRIDLPAGERVVTRLVTRSGRLLFTSLVPGAESGEVWVNEVDRLAGGAPHAIVYDLDGNGALDGADNVDGNGDDDTFDPEDRVTAIFQGGGLVATAPTLAILDAHRGTYFVNRIEHVMPDLSGIEDGGVAGGHFDVDTSSFIAPLDAGSTDGHVHEYDDKYATLGVDFFGFATDSLHDIDTDITDPAQRFKLLVVNDHLSPRGRLSFNRVYDALDPASYAMVTDYAAIPLAELPVYSLGGGAGSEALTRAALYFDEHAILARGLHPTQTGCVRSNTPTSAGEWRNGALTVWAVAVDASGADAFDLTHDDDGRIVGISEGLLWETTVFWHWKGPCAHEYDDLGDHYSVSASGETTSVWEHHASETIGFDVVETSGGGAMVVAPPETVTAPPASPPTTSPPSALASPPRTAWKESRNR